MENLIAEGWESVRKIRCWLEYIQNLETMKNDLHLEEKVNLLESNLKDIETWDSEQMQIISQIIDFTKSSYPEIMINQTGNDSATNISNQEQSVKRAETGGCTEANLNLSSPSPSSKAEVSNPSINQIPTFDLRSGSLSHVTFTGFLPRSDEKKHHTMVTNLEISTNQQKIMYATKCGIFTANVCDIASDGTDQSKEEISKIPGSFEIFQTFPIFNDEIVFAISKMGVIHILPWNNADKHSEAKKLEKTFSTKNFKDYNLPGVVDLLSTGNSSWKLFPRPVIWQNGEKSIETIMVQLDTSTLALFPQKNKIKKAEFVVQDDEGKERPANIMETICFVAVDDCGLPYWVQKNNENAQSVLTTTKNCRIRTSQNKKKVAFLISVRPDILLNNLSLVPKEFPGSLWAVQLDLPEWKEKCHMWWKSSSGGTKPWLNFTFGTEFQQSGLTDTDVDVVTTLRYNSSMNLTHFCITIGQDENSFTVSTKPVFAKKFQVGSGSWVLVKPTTLSDCKDLVTLMSIIKADYETRESEPNFQIKPLF